MVCLLENLRVHLYTNFNNFRSTVYTRSFIIAILLGQCLSLLICGTAIASGLLQNMSINIPTGQSLPSYCLLTVTFNLWNLVNVGLAGYKDIFKNRAIKYILIGALEVEANYFIVKAYQFTSVTSVQLLDCLATPTVLLLSIKVLKKSFNWANYLGVVVCLLGAGLLILSDVLTGNHNGAQSNQFSESWKGDLLCALGAVLYGISNICQEAIVCKHGIFEYLAMMSYFASIVSGIQFVILERNEFTNIDFSFLSICLPFALFNICLFIFYSLMSYAISKTSAMSVNLNLLSSDFFSLLAGIFIFQYKFHGLYFGSFFIILFGLILYNLQSKPTTKEECTSTLPQLINEEMICNESKQIDKIGAKMTEQNLLQLKCTVDGSEKFQMNENNNSLEDNSCSMVTAL